MNLKIHNPNKLPTLTLSDLIQIQGNLKTLDEKNYEKLKKSLIENGFDVPFFVWIPTKDEAGTIDGEPIEIKKGLKYSLDGNQRQRVLTKEGNSKSRFPYIKIDCKNFAEAKKAILRISSQYGKISQEGLDAFSFDIPDNWKDTTISFDALFAEPYLPENKEKEIEIDNTLPTDHECPKCGYKY